MKKILSNLNFGCAKSIFIVLMMLCVPLGMKAQNVNVYGKVTDAATGDEIIYATVKVEGTGTGTTTDIEGNYKLSVPVGSTLEFSYVGYLTQKVKVSKAGAINVAMKEDAKLVDEVVVVGYGTMKRSDLSGSSITIGEDALKGSIITNLDQSLQGRATGVTAVQTSGAPGSASSIRVRGIASINANQEPLYVIDGVIFQASGQSGSDLGLGDRLGNGSVSTVSPLSTLNPSDIVSMEILKDASATAIYGAQGANGVILNHHQAWKERRCQIQL